MAILKIHSQLLRSNNFDGYIQTVTTPMTHDPGPMETPIVCGGLYTWENITKDLSLYMYSWQRTIFELSDNRFILIFDDTIIECVVTLKDVK